MADTMSLSEIIGKLAGNQKTLSALGWVVAEDCYRRPERQAVTCLVERCVKSDVAVIWGEWGLKMGYIMRTHLALCRLIIKEVGGIVKFLPVYEQAR